VQAEHIQVVLPSHPEWLVCVQDSARDPAFAMDDEHEVIDRAIGLAFLNNLFERAEVTCQYLEGGHIADVTKFKDALQCRSMGST